MKINFCLTLKSNYSLHFADQLINNNKRWPFFWAAENTWNQIDTKNGQLSFAQMVSKLLSLGWSDLV